MSADQATQFFLVDRIIPESATQHKFNRSGIARSSLAQAAAGLGASALVLYEHGRKKRS